LDFSLQVTEIYESVQGESTLTGLPCTFIRLSGCPLRCRWCDTVYSFEGGETLGLETIVQRVKALGPKLVELTGGEPLAQANASMLCEKLIAEGFDVMIETSGSFDVSVLPKQVHIVMDLKCPDSGMEDKNMWDNLTHLKSTDDLKFVVASYDDFLWADKVIRENDLGEKLNALVSPAFGLVKPDELVAWMLECRTPARLNLQIHKYIWNPRKKGV
jgi:7-carboxy-7-deazaguanine synthase